MRGKAMLTTVASRPAIPEPRTVASRTHRPAGEAYRRPGDEAVCTRPSCLGSRTYADSVRADRVRRVLPGTVAVAGVVAAHAADYAVLYPDPAVRDRELLANGHGYWPGAVLVAAVLGAVALAVAGGRGSRGRRTPLPSLARLAAIQAVLFPA